MPVLVGRFRALHRQYGDVFRFYVGPKLFLVVTRAEDGQKVLTVSRRRDPYCIRPFRNFFGDGLITNFGKKWKSHRRALEPAFRREVVVKLTDTFNNGAKFVCERLAKSIGSEQDIYPVLFQGALRSIVYDTFGLTLDELIPDSLERDEWSEKIVSLLIFMQKRIIRPWMHPDWTLFLTAEGQWYRKERENFHKIIRRGVEIASHIALNGEHDHMTLLTDILRGHSGGNDFSAEDLHDTACTLVLGGSDTTAATVAYVLSLLGLYPEWQQRAVQELNDVYGEGEDYLRPSTMNDLSQLVVLESIIKETMRLLPVIPAIPHEVDEDVPLDGGRYTAPRGSSIFVAYCVLHRQPDVFNDPDKFDPGRFLDGRSALRSHAYSYLPFGGGPRICIGARYGKLHTKLLLSALLRHFRILPGSTLEELEEVVLSITGHPVTGYRAKLLLRDVNSQQSSK